MPIVITVQSDLVRIDYSIIIFGCYYLHRAIIALRLAFCHIFRNHFIFQSILESCGACDARAKFQHIPVFANQFVSISRNIWTRTDK